MARQPLHPCAQPGCPALTARRYCAVHQRQRDQVRDARRGTAAMRGYDAAWQRVRRAVLARDGGRCQHCGSTQHLQVHHIIPLSHGGARTDPRNLVTLCARCHARQHGGR